MVLDVRKFFQATNPGKTLFVENPEEDKKYYIDFSSVRGGQIIADLKDNIALWSPDEATCQLFTGHVGCGKSTELLRLKADLEREDFHVVYFESDEDLELGDVDVSDILLAIARQVSNSLEQMEQMEIAETKGLKEIILGATKILGNIDWSVEEVNLGIMGIGKITAKTKASPELRNKLRGYLEPQTKGIIEAINQELLEPGIKRLKKLNKKGLVVIVDNLDKLDSSPKPWGRPQHEYIFIDRGEQLRGLNCHIVYTMPLALRFSSDFDTMTNRFRLDPKVLPMVPTKLRDGSVCREGRALMRQMVLARAFPDLDEEERLSKIAEVFDSPITLDRLCFVSGGHVRNLLRILNESIKKQRGQLPIYLNYLEEVIRAYRNERILAVDKDEWSLLRQVDKEKNAAGNQYQRLIRSMFVYEYRYSQEVWFDINPILVDAKELRQ